MFFKLLSELFSPPKTRGRKSTSSEQVLTWIVVISLLLWLS